MWQAPCPRSVKYGQMAETELSLGNSTVSRGRAIIADQEARIEKLRADGLDTRDAEQTLDLFRRSQHIFESYLEKLEAEAKSNGHSR
jgi:hypothetical protein